MKRKHIFLPAALIFLSSAIASGSDNCDKDGVLLTRDIKIEDYKRLSDGGFKLIQFKGRSGKNSCTNQYLYAVQKNSISLERFVLSVDKTSKGKPICNLGSQGTTLASQANSITINGKIFCRVKKGVIRPTMIGKSNSKSDYVELAYAEQIRAQRESEMPQYGRDLQNFLDFKIGPGDLANSPANR